MNPGDAKRQSALQHVRTPRVATVAHRASIRLDGDPDSLRVTLDGRDASEEIRGEGVGHAASVVSTIPEVRRELVRRQREMGEQGAVLNGRDIGTVVFPNADVKFFLTASADERAWRRFDEEHPQALTFEQVHADMTERDRRDTTRADSPLLKADDAVLIDSSGLSIDEVFAKMMEAIRKKSG